MLRELIRQIVLRFGYEEKKSDEKYSDPRTLEKASSLIERFREVVSDPLNLLIERVPEAGYVDEDDYVILHNGNRVSVKGPYSYYGGFSDVLIINRGVHEPLEEYCFQTVLSKLKTESPKMIELGAYWAHYSMWLQKLYPKATCYMVEPDNHNLNCGKHNFSVNGYRGKFINEAVGSADFQLDLFVSERGIKSLDIIHADIQGYETEMLLGSKRFLSENRAGYIFISTHSESIHLCAVKQLRAYLYRIEVSSGFDTHTTSGDGFILATSPKLEPLFTRFSPLGRIDIANASSKQLMESLSSIQR